ncbi:MAG TPA: MAE_28990/MAE_18760 family HEPN-like nuclease [Pirellulales bacterium]|nr:MAE_28990/MAE_18760 family HEPN-like nuclease [Pirellulales bacterium]
MAILSDSFDERLQEIEAYLQLLEALERQVQLGPPIIGGAPITAQQQKILYSSVYLQLYNLVEATANWCINAVTAAAADGARWTAADLDSRLRREWVRTTARTHVDMGYDSRLTTAIAFCDGIIKASPIGAWNVEKGGGGNWDDREIEEISERIGCELSISRPIEAAAKRRIREDMGSLRLVKYLRNRLAHGQISFEECGDGVTVPDLVDIKDRTAGYLREVIAAFERYIADFGFIAPERRPSPGKPI